MVNMQAIQSCFPLNVLPCITDLYVEIDLFDTLLSLSYK